MRLSYISFGLEKKACESHATSLTVLLSHFKKMDDESYQVSSMANLDNPMAKDDMNNKAILNALSCFQQSIQTP